jgi:hypothetical protein
VRLSGLAASGHDRRSARHRIQPYEGPVWSYSARVTLGDNIQGIAGLKTAASAGDTIRCKVTQVDHQMKLVALDQADAL